jgi:hypothetical protein
VVHANTVTIGDSQVVLGALALDRSLLMILICFATILDPLSAVGIRDAVDKCAAVELVGRADRSPVLLMLLLLYQLQDLLIVIGLRNIP